jgi:hypothetical protein
MQNYLVTDDDSLDRAFELVISDPQA